MSNEFALFRLLGLIDIYRRYWTLRHTESRSGDGAASDGFWKTPHGGVIAVPVFAVSQDPLIQ